MITSMVPSGTSARIDVRALRQDIFAKRLPWSEKYRNVYGPDLDIDRIADAIQGARVGIMVWLSDIAREQLVFDPHLGMLAQKRMGRLALADWTLSPRTKGLSREEKLVAKGLAEMVTAKVERIRNLRQALYDLAWGHFDARACLEIDWQWTGGRAPYTPVSLDWIHPRRIGFGPEREPRLIEANIAHGWFEPVGTAFRDIPGKFITYLPRRFGDYPELEGLAPRSIYYSFFKRFAVRKRNELTELFVLPWRTLEADKDAPLQKEDMDAAVEIAEALGDQTVAGFPPGVRFNALWPGSENQGQIMGATIADVDSQMSRLWELTDSSSKAKADAGGGQGGDQAGFQLEQQQMAFALDGVGISERIQAELVEKIVELNAGPDLVYLAPIFEIRTAPPKDRNAEQKRYSQALLDGVPVALTDYYEATGIRAPEDDEAVLVMTQAAPGGAPGAVTILVPEGAKAPPGLVPPPAPPALGAGPAEEKPIEDRPAGAPLLNALALARQPDLGHGSPEIVVDHGVARGAVITSRWAHALLAAVAGHADAAAIGAALNRAAETLELEPLAVQVEEALVRGAMLGALDSALEGSHLGLVRIGDEPAFALDNLGSIGRPTPGFAATPFHAAIQHFQSRRILPPEDFARLTSEAKRHAFTVAGLARDEQLQTAHAALGRAIAEGADLRAFDKDLTARFDSAGWTQLKPSHVELIFRNATMNAYAVGRDQQQRQPEVLARRPFGRS